MEHVLVKVYGAIHPATPEMLQAASSVVDANCLELEGDMLRISFEGVWFMIDELIEVLIPLLYEGSAGRIDYIDVEAWKLHRYNFTGNNVTLSSRDLNTILDYSGH